MHKKITSDWIGIFVDQYNCYDSYSHIFILTKRLKQRAAVAWLCWAVSWTAEKKSIITWSGSLLSEAKIPFVEKVMLNYSPKYTIVHYDNDATKQTQMYNKEKSDTIRASRVASYKYALLMKWTERCSARLIMYMLIIAPYNTCSYVNNVHHHTGQIGRRPQPLTQLRSFALSYNFTPSCNKRGPILL